MIPKKAFCHALLLDSINFDDRFSCYYLVIVKLHFFYRKYPKDSLASAHDRLALR